MIAAGTPIAGRVALLVTAALLMNLPLGYYRQGTRKYSFLWFVLIHASIPFLILFRIGMGISYWYIPFSLGFAVLGQVAGGRIRRQKGR